MARPSPVVRVATELTNRAGRSTYQTNIAEYLFGKHIVAIAAIESLDFVAIPRARSSLLTHNLGGKRGEVSWREELQPCGVLDTFESLLYRCGYICYLVYDLHFESGVYKLFGKRIAPETILEVIVLYTTMLLYLIVAAVVIGKEQALIRNQHTRTSTIKQHYRIGERGAVGIINIGSFELHPEGFHPRYLPVDLLHQPHSPIGIGECSADKC